VVHWLLQRLLLQRQWRLETWHEPIGHHVGLGLSSKHVSCLNSRGLVLRIVSFSGSCDGPRQRWWWWCWWKRWLYRNLRRCARFQTRHVVGHRRTSFHRVDPAHSFIRSPHRVVGASGGGKPGSSGMTARITRSKSSEKVGVGGSQVSPLASEFPVLQELNNRVPGGSSLATSPLMPFTAMSEPRPLLSNASSSSEASRMEGGLSRSDSYGSLHTLVPNTCTVSSQAQSTSRRKQFRVLDRGCKRRPSSEESLPSGLFDALGDDQIVDIMMHVVDIPAGTTMGLDLRNTVCSGARSLGAFVATCLRIGNVLNTAGFELNQEMNARAATHIAPAPHVFNETKFPFTRQLRLECKSSDQLRLLRDSISGLAVHCAGSCCARSRVDVNHKRPKCTDTYSMVVPIAERSSLLTASLDGHYSFVATRKRIHKSERRHGNETTPFHHREFVVRYSYAESSTRKGRRVDCIEKNRIELDRRDSLSAPLTIRSNYNGSSVAIIRGLHSLSIDQNVPYSLLSVWMASTGGFHERVDPPCEAVNLGALNVQEMWWINNGQEDEQLAVVWSTAYVHPMGSVVGANADNACYFIASYDTTDFEIDHYIGPFYGKAQTASPTSNGTEVAVLVRNAPVGTGPGSIATRSTRVHCLSSEESIDLDHGKAIGYGRTSFGPHPHDLMHCPSAVGMSPSGDCIVAIHRRYGTIIAEVLIRTASCVFVSVQTMDITHWTATGVPEPSVFDAPNTAHLASGLKLPYSVIFSPCGRFAAVVDQRPLWGLSITNHALVVLDMALRNERRGVRAMPLAPVEDVAPRSIEWTSIGMWLQPKFGSLLLWNA